MTAGAKAGKNRRSPPCEPDSMRSALTIPSLLAIIALAFAGCVEERIVRNDGPLMGLPDAKSQQERIVDDPGILLPAITDDSTITENPDGTRTARSTNVRQLIANIDKCMDEDWESVFVSDLLSTRAKTDLAAQGMTPASAFALLKTHKTDVIKLFNLMPMGEFTPGFYLRPVGNRTFRLLVPGRGADDLAFRGIDAVYERGNYRLYWLVPRE